MNRTDGIRDSAELEKRIGHVFADRGLLTEALTHSSYSNEHGGQKKVRCNERLEFLGDSVLSLVVSDFLFRNFPDSPEGELTRMRAELVNEKACAEYASGLCLGDYLLLGKGEEKGGGRRRRSVIADAYEALLAAVWLDAGEGTGGKEAVSAYSCPRSEPDCRRFSGNGAARTTRPFCSRSFRRTRRGRRSNTFLKARRVRITTRLSQ